MIFLTGATGTVGNAMLHRLLSEGKKVRALIRDKQHADYTLGDLVEWVEGDVLDVIGLTKHLSGVTQVIHAAALVSFNPRDKHRLLKVNVEGTANVVNAAVENGVSDFCFISSVAALGRGKDELINEQAKWENSSYNSAYAGSKYLAELEVWRGQEEGLNVLIVCPSVVLGGHDWDKSSAKLFRFGYAHTTFFTEGSFSYVDLRDVVEKTLFLLANGRFGERYILSAGTVTFQHFFSALAQRFGKKPPAIKLNKFVVYLVYQFERLRSLVSGSTPLITRETAHVKKKSYHYDHSKVLAETGGEFTPLQESIDHYCAVFVDKYNLKA